MPAMDSAVVQRKLKKSYRLDTRNEVNEGRYITEHGDVYVGMTGVVFP
jgi:hypothetical protein